jgi:Cu(I)/Ag(I) efflux system membrane protein CusA/SilA
VLACKEVGPALFFSLLIITVSFLPVFALEGQEGRLFSPLAFTKTFAMAGAALLSVTLVPVLMLFFVRGRILPEAKNPVNRLLIWLYRPIIKAVLRFKLVTLLLAVLAMAATIAWPARQIGSEFMPTLNEGTLFYMPAALPGMSVTEAGRLLQTTNRIIKTFPEVASVYRQGRPRQHRDRPGAARDVRDRDQPQAAGPVAPGHDHRQADRRDGRRAQVPRPGQLVDDADQGAHRHAQHRHPHPGGGQGVRQGPGELEKVAQAVEAAVRKVPGASSAYAERVAGGYYVDIVPRRDQLARYGLTIDMLQDVIATALGGEMVTTTVEGRERYGVSVRYARGLRDDPQRLAPTCSCRP